MADATHPASAPAASSVRPWRHVSRADVTVLAWSVVLAIGLLGPALGAGYVLSYDMVWVPDLAVTSDVWGLGSALPRAVPSDAVVALLDEVVPGAWLQKVVLVASLVGAGVGGARLVASYVDGRLLVRLLAVALWQWNPFVVERLVIGHWPVLLAYAVLPWILLLARRWRDEQRLPVALLVLVPVGSLSASAALATAVVVIVAATGRRRTRAVMALLAAASAPWVVAGLVHAGDATTDAAGASVFALGGEGSVPAPLAALTLGGIWNVDVVPDSRLGPLGWVTLVVLAALAAVGARRWWRSTPRRDRRVLLACWGVGYGAGLVTWAVPDVLGTLGAVVPGLGLLRDGGRLLLLCTPLLVVLVAHGAAVVVDRLPRSPLALVGAGLALALLPLALLPDAGWGASGRLRAVDYPASWTSVCTVLAGLGSSEGDGPSVRGDALVLPASSFRAPVWNGGRTVLDPLGRFLTVEAVSDDSLVVGGARIAGEDPRSRAAQEALTAPTPEQRSVGLARLGIGLVVVDEEAAAQLDDPAPEVAGTPVLGGGDELSVTVLDDVRPEATSTSRLVAVSMGWAAFGGLLLAFVIHSLVTTRRRVRRRSRRA